MGEITEKLYYRKDGTTHNIKLYDTTADLPTPSDFVAFRINGSTAYAGLDTVGTSGESDMRVRKSSSTKSFLSEASSDLTSVSFDWYKGYLGYPSYGNQAGLEDGIGSSGGNPVAYFNKSNNSYLNLPGSGFGDEVRSVALNVIGISWDNRYNYRIGMANVYKVYAIRLYENGVLTETQTPNILMNGSSRNSSYSGININPSNRNITSSNIGSLYIGYPK